MTKSKLIFIGLAVALVGFLFAGSASAQGPSLSADPPSVAEAGDHTFTVTGSGWNSASINVLACKVAEGDDAATVDPSTNCTMATGNLDFGSMTPATVTDGSIEVSLTLSVPEQGILIVAGDSAQTESASLAITVGMMEDDMMDDDMMDDDMLADTGVETSLLVIIGAGIALAGVMVFGLSRRLRTS